MTAKARKPPDKVAGFLSLSMGGRNNDTNIILKQAFVDSVPTIKSNDNVNNSIIVSAIGCDQ